MAEEIKEEIKWSDRTVRQKIHSIVKNITVEPMLFCYIFPCALGSLAAQNINLEKACRVNLNYSNEVCSALNERETKGYEFEEKECQRLVANMAVWRTFISSFFPCMLIMFSGAYSDRKGRRKPFMLIPMVGEILCSISGIISAYFFYEIPMEVGGFFDSLFPSLSGGWGTMYMAVFSYIADITDNESRTFRIGIANMFFSVGAPIGSALSGVAFKATGYFGVFGISVVIFLIGLTYGMIRIKDVRPSKNTPSRISDSVDETVTKEDNLNQQSVLQKLVSFLKDYFSLVHIRNTFSIALRQGKNNRKKRILLLLVLVVVVNGPGYGEWAVFYLFMRYRFNWDVIQYSMFSTYSTIIHIIGTTFSVTVFSHLLKIDDALIGVMSCLSKILAGFVYAFAQTDFQVYMAPLADIVNGTSSVAMRSIASKLVSSEELGKLNSLLGAVEAVTPLLYGPMYAFMYGRTMHIMPGAFFLVGGVLILPAVVIFCWMYTQHKLDRECEDRLRRKSSLAEDVMVGIKVPMDPVAAPRGSSSSAILMPLEPSIQLTEPKD